MNSVFANLPVSVFEVMSRLAREQDAVNLGQGFPDGPFPEDVLAKAADAVVNGWNQYPPMMGLPELRRAVATHYKHWQNLDFDPETARRNIEHGYVDTLRVLRDSNQMTDTRPSLGDREHRHLMDQPVFAEAI